MGPARLTRSGGSRSSARTLLCPQTCSSSPRQREKARSSPEGGTYGRSQLCTVQYSSSLWIPSEHPQHSFRYLGPLKLLCAPKPLPPTCKLLSAPKQLDDPSTNSWVPPNPLGPHKNWGLSPKTLSPS